MAKINIAIIEDDLEKSAELKSLINSDENFLCEFTYRSPNDALSFLPNHPEIDIIIIDIDLKASINGIHLIELLKPKFDQQYIEKKRQKEVKFLIHTISESRDNVMSALASGASGYIAKGDKRVNIIYSLLDIQAGGSPMSSQIARHLINIFGSAAHKTSREFIELTAAENQVLRLISEGLSNLLISKKLTIAEGTVKQHCNRIYRKLHVKNRAEALEVYQEKLRIKNN
jgi:DNA-binding NarL/FixJ family response regulator